MGIITAVCMSAEKGTPKTDVGQAEVIAQHGLKNDAHAGKGIKQVSMLSLQKIELFRSLGAQVDFGAFGENLVIDGIDLACLPLGTKLRSGDVLLEISKIGKECHNFCAIYKKMGDCIMPREGVFAQVIHGGTIKNGDEINVE